MGFNIIEGDVTLRRSTGQEHVGQQAMADSVPVVVASDQTPIPVVPASPAPEDVFREDLLNGASPDMNVDGSGTPVVFKVDADPTDDIKLRELRLTISGAKVYRFDGATFGEGGSVLTNGILIEATINGGTTVMLANIVRNEGFFRLQSTGVTPFYAANGANELIAVSLILGGAQLNAGTADQIKITIRDNLTAGGATKTKHFRATLYGSK